MNGQLDAFEGDQLRDEGMKKAGDNAEKKSPGWQDRALGFLMAFPENEFLIEDVRVWAHKAGLPKPPHGRAWGPVARAASDGARS